MPHSLIRMANGELGYITKRIDRTKNGEKVDMEDMCQLTLHPTEYKYKGSHEQIAKAIMQYCDMPKLELANYMQLLLFCFVTGNNDMHLKNFSIYRPKNIYQLAPAYDLLNIAIANPIASPAFKKSFSCNFDLRPESVRANSSLSIGLAIAILRRS